MKLKVGLRPIERIIPNKVRIVNYQGPSKVKITPVGAVWPGFPVKLRQTDQIPYLS
jgi:hypothetical protein